MANSAAGSRHLSTHIDRPAKLVYDYASNPANLPSWAPGLGTSIDEVDGQWIMDSPMGRIVVAFAPANEFGVLDHHVTVPSGETFYNPMRVMVDGEGSELVFTLRRLPDMTDEEFQRDADLVLADLRKLRDLLESA